MSTQDGDVSRREQAGWLAKLKDVLFEGPRPSRAFEDERNASSAVHDSAKPTASSSIDSEVLAALKSTVQERLGPSFSEFQLQMEALGEAIPDEPARMRAALRVLERKGVSVSGLLQGLQAGLDALAGSRQSWSEKVEARRRAHQSERQSVEAEYQQSTGETQSAIARLKDAIEAQRQKMEAAEADKQRRLDAIDQASRELTDRERSFHDTFIVIEQAYGSLREKLARFQTEKAHHG